MNSMTKAVFESLNGTEEVRQMAIATKNIAHGKKRRLIAETLKTLAYVEVLDPAKSYGGVALAILRHAIDKDIDWNFIAEQILATPEAN